MEILPYEMHLSLNGSLSIIEFVHIERLGLNYVKEMHVINISREEPKYRPLPGRFPRAKKSKKIQR